MTTLSEILIVIAEKFHIALRIKNSPKAPGVGVLSECEHLQDSGYTTPPCQNLTRQAIIFRFYNC